MDILQKFKDLKRQFESSVQSQFSNANLSEAFDEFEALLRKKQFNGYLESENYKKLFENASDYIFILSSNGTILTVNAAACERYKIPYDEFINTSIWQIDATQDKDAILREVDKLLKTGSSRFEVIHRNRDGEHFYLDVIAQKITWNNDTAFVHICRDITIQKQLQKALNDSEIKLKKIIDQISDGILIYELDGKIIIWNSGAENITGVKTEDALGRLLYDLQYDILSGKYKNKDLIRQMFDEMIKMSNPDAFNKLFENEIYVEGKGVRIIQAIVFPIELGENDRLFGSVLRDITEVKQIENQLRELNSTKDKIFSIIAHDLRAPFSSIIGFTDLLLQNYEKYDSDRIKKILQYINLSAKPTLDVLTNLLNWVNVQTGQLGFQPEVCSLRNLVQEVVEMMTPTAQIKNLTLSNVLGDDYIVYADMNMIKSVLQNLIVNAIKFSHPGGKVDVNAHKENTFVEIEVTDEGVGIDENKLAALFRVDSHESTKGTMGEKGSGLGLILCKEFIDKHGGEIRVESRPGQGSRFLFTVPLAVEKRAANSLVADA